MVGCNADNLNLSDGYFGPASGSAADESVPEDPESGDKYADFADNPFVNVSEQPVSTFSVDADGASYANMRRYVTERMLPPANAVRIEEFLNYFTFAYEDPEGEHNISLNAEIAACPWTEGHRLLRLGLKGKSIPESEAPISNFVFLIDVSGSMDSPDKLPLLKTGLKMLVDYMRPDDRIAIVTYSGDVKKLLASTPASEASTIKDAISKLNARGSTAGAAAMQMAYEEAVEHYIEGGNNRVIMGTDGDFNVGVTGTDALVEMVEGYADKGVYLTVCGFGRGNLNDSMIERVTNSGNGTFEYIDDEKELTKVFVNERSEFLSVANDTKIQLTFSPSSVESYRLIGYENRVMSQEDFENDQKDAGEIGAGQTITALYEIVPAEGYGLGDKIALFDVRYKKSFGEESIPLSLDIYPSDDLSETFSDNMSLAAGIAAYGMVLRNSPYKGESSFELARSLVDAVSGEFDSHGYVEELSELITAASGIR